MFNWFKLQVELYIARREETRRYIREREQIRYEEDRQLQAHSFVCESCENLKMQVAQQIQIINKLHEQLFKAPEIQVPIHATKDNVPVTKPRGTPWNVTRQMLENESRKQANEILKKKQIEIQVDETPKSVDELEKEVVESWESNIKKG